VVIYTIKQTNVCACVDGGFGAEIHTYKQTFKRTHTSEPAAPPPDDQAVSHVTHCWQMSVWYDYGVATISRLLKIVGLFCRI